MSLGALKGGQKKKVCPVCEESVHSPLLPVMNVAMNSALRKNINLNVLIAVI